LPAGRRHDVNGSVLTFCTFTVDEWSSPPSPLAIAINIVHIGQPVSNPLGHAKAKKVDCGEPPNGKIARLPRNIRDELLSKMALDRCQARTADPAEDPVKQA